MEVSAPAPVCSRPRSKTSAPEDGNPTLDAGTVYWLSGFGADGAANASNFNNFFAVSNGAVGTAANGMLFAPNAGVPGWTPVENALVPPALAFWCAIDGTCHIDDPCVAACASVEAVHVGPSNAILNGTAGADVLCGDERDDVIRGKGGDDLICGFAGADTLNGNDGADEIHGDGGGDDTDKLFGELGGDVCENGETVLTCENF